MKFINMNITDVTYGIVCHQVNCQGVMGAGVALAIRKKWPIVFEYYRKAYTDGTLKPGGIVFVMVKEGLCVANICGQNYYGRKGKFTDYTAIDKALKYLYETTQKINRLSGKTIPIYFPNNMGSGLAGGNWNIVIKIIEKHFPDAIIVNYP